VLAEGEGKLGLLDSLFEELIEPLVETLLEVLTGLLVELPVEALVDAELLVASSQPTSSNNGNIQHRYFLFFI